MEVFHNTFPDEGGSYLKAVGSGTWPYNLALAWYFPLAFCCTVVRFVVLAVVMIVVSVAVVIVLVAVVAKRQLPEEDYPRPQETPESSCFQGADAR